MEVYRVEDKDIYEVIDELIKNELENNINIMEDEIFNKELENNFKLDEEFKNRIKTKVKKSISIQLCRYNWSSYKK